MVRIVKFKNKLSAMLVLTIIITGVFSNILLVGRGSGPVGTASGSMMQAVDWWPMFHHDLSHTGYSSSTPPNTNHTLWSYPTDGAVSSSPAVADGMVFVGSYDCNVYALDYLTGEKVWNYTTDDLVVSSPAVADGMVFVGSYDCNVYALDYLTGEKVWNYTTDDLVVSSPAVADGMVFVGSYDNNVYALDASSGAFIWSYPTGDYVYSSPAVADGKVFVGSADTKVYALDASTGAHIWNYTTSERVYSSPTYYSDYGMVYVSSVDGNVYALDALTGEERWSCFTGQNVVSSPAVAYGGVYVGSYYDDAKVWALNGQTGDVIWSRTTGNHSVPSSPAVAFGMVYVGSNDLRGDPKYGEVIGKICALDAFRGETVWNYTTGGSVDSSPAVADNKVYVGSCDNRVYAFGIPVLSAWAYATPTIDGRIFPGALVAYSFSSYTMLIAGPEWADAARVDFTLKYGAESHPAALYVMNDYINLYLALEVRNENFDYGDVASFSFDNDHNGVKDVGDNHLIIRAGLGGCFEDRYFRADGIDEEDTQDGGSNDGAGNAYYCVATSTLNLEMVYPLNSGDDDHDFSLSIGSTVGFNLRYYDSGGLGGGYSWPSAVFSGMATIRIAGPPSPPYASNADLSITGIEVTQAIQDLSNSLRLVSGKATVVRVYVDIGQIDLIWAIDVTVHLYGMRAAGPGIESLGAFQTSFSAPRNPNRGTTSHTANFLLPTSWTQSNLILKAFVKASSARQSETNYDNNWMAEESFEFHHQRVPSIYIYPIDRGTASNPNLPTDTQIADTESYFETIFPVSNVNFIHMPPVYAAGHSTQLNEDLLFFWLLWCINHGVAPIRTDQVYGLHSGLGGVASPLYWDEGAGLAASGGWPDHTMSHEINHNWGTYVKNNETTGWGWGGHVPFGANAPTDFIDLSWPYTDGTIQEFGFDTRTMTVVQNTRFDFMTYEFGVWISPYRWEAAFDRLPQVDLLSTFGESMGTMEQGGESLVISGWVSSNGSGSLDPVFRLPGVVQSNSTPGIYALVLQDSDGATLLTHSFQPEFINVDGEQDDPHHFFMVLPHINGTTQVLLTYGNATILDEIVMSQNAPTVTVLSPNGGESWESGVQTIGWTASDLDGDSLTYQVFYSTDNGTVWSPLALGLTETYYEVDASFIPGSPNALFKVVASDGFNIGEDSSDAVFTVTDKPPRAMILHPEDEAQFLMDDVILLDGFGIDTDDAILPETAYNWTSDIDGYLGNGTTLTAMLTLGTHNITFTVTDSQGNEASDTIIISVTPYFEITSVTPSRTVVGQGFSVPINVTAVNRGPITQKFRVYVLCDESVAPTAEQWDEFWSMGDVNRDGYIDQADVDLIMQWFGYPVPPAPSECDLNGDGEVDIFDAAILAANYGLDIWTHFGLSPPPIILPTAEQWDEFWSMGDVNRDGYIDDTDGDLITAALLSTPGSPNWNPDADLNQDLVVDGDDLTIFSWHYGLDIWSYCGLSPPPIGMQNVILPPGASETLTFTWNTTGFAHGNYTLRALLEAYPGETSSVKNTYADGRVLVTIPGDVDGDLDVDYDDFIVLAGAYGSSSGQPAYDERADFDDDGDVDYDDFIVLAGNYGKTV